MVRRRVPLLAIALVLGGLWWWAVLRLSLTPERAGIVEGAVAASGWGLSLLPVHVASARPSRSRAERARGPAGAPSGLEVRESARRLLRAVTTAWSRRRSGGGSDPS
ncbi:hypothetical protein [Streptomyces sp. NPDC047928]|uniref:hypothetical protein n=1 Tax=unclassified Streptomyces TaxID=2593676 RepID=UPI0037206D3B